jgi:hypothetical protein
MSIPKGCDECVTEEVVKIRLGVEFNKSKEREMAVQRDRWPRPVPFVAKKHV